VEVKEKMEDRTFERMCEIARKLDENKATQKEKQELLEWLKEWR
jgi:hypothetical protein